MLIELHFAQIDLQFMQRGFGFWRRMNGKVLQYSNAFVLTSAAVICSQRCMDSGSECTQHDLTLNLSAKSSAPISVKHPVNDKLFRRKLAISEFHCIE